MTSSHAFTSFEDDDDEDFAQAQRGSNWLGEKYTSSSGGLGSSSSRSSVSSNRVYHRALATLRRKRNRFGTNALANGVNSGDGAIKLDANGAASTDSPVRSRTGSADALGGFEKGDEDDFDDGDILVERTRSRATWKRKRSVSFTVWLFLFLLGTLMAVCGYALDYFAVQIYNGRVAAAELSPYEFVNALTWISIPLVLALLAALVTDKISRDSQGSGIPEMKVILGGATLSNFLSLRTFAAKFLGLTFSLGAGLFIGKEGPFVHIAAIVANQLTRIPFFRPIAANPVLKRHVLAAAVSAGVTAAFGASVGGVLFSIEVTSSYFQVDNFWRAFFCSTVTLLWFSLRDGFLLGDLFEDTNFKTFPLDWQIITFSLLGLICGLIAVAFISSVWKIFELRRATPTTRWGAAATWLLQGRYRYVVVVALATSLLGWPAFLRHPDHTTINEMFLTEELWDERQQAGTLSHWTNPTQFANLVIFLVVKLVLTAFSICMPIPAGVFTPVFAAGSVFGRWYGEIIQLIVGEGTQILTGAYAVVGAAAMTAAVTRTLSTAVIVFELTEQLHHMLPVLVGTIIGYTVASYYATSIYDVMKHGKGLPSLPEAEDLPAQATAVDIHHPRPSDYNICYLDHNSTYLHAANLLVSSHYFHFPVVKDRESMILLGSITRANLEDIVKTREDTIETRTGIKCAQFRGSAVRVGRYKRDVNTHDWVSEVLSDRGSSPAPIGSRRGSNDSQGAHLLGDHHSVDTSAGLPLDPIASSSYQLDSSPPATTSGKNHIELQALSSSSSSSNGSRSLSRPSAASTLSLAHSESARSPSAGSSSSSNGSSAADSEPPHGEHKERGAASSAGRVAVELAKPSVVIDTSSLLSDQEKAKSKKSDTDREVYDSYMKQPIRHHIAALINQSPFVVTPQTKLRKVHYLFVLLNLTQVFVLNTGRLVGVITQEDLIEFSGL